MAYSSTGLDPTTLVQCWIDRIVLYLYSSLLTERGHTGIVLKAYSQETYLLLNILTINEIHL